MAANAVPAVDQIVEVQRRVDRDVEDREAAAREEVAEGRQAAIGEAEADRHEDDRRRARSAPTRIAGVIHSLSNASFTR